MRFSLKQSLGLALLAAMVSGGAVQALPPVVIQAQAEAEQAARSTVIAAAAGRSNPVSQSILSLTNQARSESKLGSLSLSNQLNAAAQRHANDLASGAQFSHTGSDGSRMVNRVEDAGYAYRSIAENIYAQSPSNRPERAVQGWLRSTGHRRNMLNGKFTEMGVGYATDGRSHYYVQVFGTPQ